MCVRVSVRLGECYCSGVVGCIDVWVKHNVVVDRSNDSVAQASEGALHGWHAVLHLAKAGVELDAHVHKCSHLYTCVFVCECREKGHHTPCMTQHTYLAFHGRKQVFQRLRLEAMQQHINTCLCTLLLARCC